MRDYKFEKQIDIAQTLAYIGTFLFLLGALFADTTFWAVMFLVFATVCCTLVGVTCWLMNYEWYLDEEDEEEEQ